MMREMGGTRNYSHVLTLFVLFAAVAEFGPQVVSNGWHLDPMTSERLRMVMLYAYAVGATLTSVVLMRGHYWGAVALFWKDRLLTVAYFSVLLSVTINTAWPRPMLAFAAICSFLVFCLIPKLKMKVDPAPVAYLLIVLTITPLVMFKVFGLNYGFIISESFRGFFDGRTTYAFASGLALILILTTRNWLLYIFFPLVATALGLSGSRTGMLAFTAGASLLCIYSLSAKHLRYTILILFAIVLVWVMPWAFSMTGQLNDFGQIRLIDLFSFRSGFVSEQRAAIGIFYDTYNRMDIYNASLQALNSNIFLFGHGDFYQTVSVGDTKIEPHNNILQTLINFGIFVCLFWLFLLGRLYEQISFEGRALLIFWFCFGLFQPGFDAFLFLPASMLVLVMAHR